MSKLKEHLDQEQNEEIDFAYFEPRLYGGYTLGDYKHAKEELETALVEYKINNSLMNLRKVKRLEEKIAFMVGNYDDYSNARVEDYGL